VLVLSWEGDIGECVPDVGDGAGGGGGGGEGDPLGGGHRVHDPSEYS
jgi:hypothetical protein